MRAETRHELWPIFGHSHSMYNGTSTASVILSWICRSARSVRSHFNRRTIGRVRVPLDLECNSAMPVEARDK